jgi:peptidoglycan/LPS O-acetylase OafA/YrhL
MPAPAPWLEFIPETGFIGVHLFFFLSGFVITYPFLRAAAAGKAQPSWGHFAWRRFIKIVPSYLLSIAIAYGIGYAHTQSLGEPVWRDLVTHLLFIHTWWPDTYGGINGVLWTLAVEVEFYCIFPIVWWFFKRNAFATAAVMIALACIWRSWAASCCLTNGFAHLEDNLPGFLDLFACGMFTAWLFVKRSSWMTARPQLSKFAPVAALASVAILVALLQNLYDFRHADQWSAVWQIDKRSLLALTFGAIAITWLWSPQWWQLVLANPLLGFLALISYNLYLYHQLIARELLAWHMPPYSGDPHYDLAWQSWYTAVAFIASIGFATMVTLGFERPIMQWRPRLTKAVPGHSSTM